jgi:septal ring factor EnvC (AmiA/AmiB activator)
LKELEVHRLKIDKEHLEAIERYKSDLSRSFADQDFDLHRRKLQLEENEQRVKLERDRIANIENANIALNKDLTQIKDELKRFSAENTELFKENRDMKD